MLRRAGLSQRKRGFYDAGKTYRQIAHRMPKRGEKYTHGGEIFTAIKPMSFPYRIVVEAPAIETTGKAEG